MTIERFPITNKGDWLEWRRRDITASEVAALFSLHPYRTALQVYLSKCSLDGDQGDSPALRRGRILEPGVAVAVAEAHPEWASSIRKADEYVRLPDMRLGASPDFYIGNPTEPGFGVLEAKTMAPEAFEQWGDGPPLAYVLQTTVQMMVTGAAWGVIGVLVTNRALDLHTFNVPRHAATEKKIAAAVADFWRRVERGEPPPPEMPADRGTLARMYRKDDGTEVDWSGENRMPEILEERAKLKEAMGTAGERVAEIDDEIKAKLGAAAIAVLPGWRITYKTHSRKEFVVPAAEVRTLRITQRGTEK